MQHLIYRLRIFLSLLFLSLSLRLNSNFLSALILWINIRKFKEYNSTKKGSKKILVFPKSGGIEDLISSFAKTQNNHLVFFWLPRIFLKTIFSYYCKNMTSKDYFTKALNVQATKEKQKYVLFLTKVFKSLDKFSYYDGFISFNIFYYAEKPFDKVCKNINKKYIILHKESALSPIEEKYHPKYYEKFNDKSLAYKISIYSESQKKILIKSNIASKNQLSIIGCPRSDYSFKLRDTKPHNKTIVFFLIETDRYVQTNFQKISIKKKTNWNKLYKKTLDYLIEFARNNPDINIILKGKIGVHEKNHFNNISLPENCTFIFKGTGEKFLRKAKIVIAFNSTIVFETIASNRNLIIPNFNNENVTKHIHMHQIKEKKYFVNSKKIFFEKLCAFISKPYKRHKFSKAEEETLKYYLGNIDGKSGIRMKNFLINNFN